MSLFMSEQGASLVQVVIIVTWGNWWRKSHVINQVKYQNTVDLIENHKYGGGGVIICPTGKLRVRVKFEGNPFFN
jgi:hypothetical protein